MQARIKVNTEGQKILNEIFTMANREGKGDLQISANLLGVLQNIEVDNEYFEKQELEKKQKQEVAKKVANKKAK